jgi:hypothetical protein
MLAGNADVRDHWVDVNTDRIILEWSLKKSDGKALSGVIWLRIETSSMLL